MKHLLLLACVVPALAWGGRPRSERNEALPVNETPPAPTKPGALVITFDLGIGSWASSLVVVTSFESSIGLGAHLTRHVLLTGQIDVGWSGNPSYTSAVLARISLSAMLAWDVFELIRAATHREIPFELGPEVALGAGVLIPHEQFALPVLQFGGFARYVFSPSLSLGLRLRGFIPFWPVGPAGFHGARVIRNTTEPSGFAATLSLIRTF